MKARCLLVATALLATFVLAITTGCAATVVAFQPEKRDLSVLDPGTPRALVVAALGEPIWTEDYHSGFVETYEFQPGEGTASRLIRSTTHAGLWYVTCGLWDLVATPYEAYRLQRKHRVLVYFNEDRDVDSFFVAQGPKSLKARGLATVRDLNATPAAPPLEPVIHSMAWESDAPGIPAEPEPVWLSPLAPPIPREPGPDFHLLAY